MKRFKSILKSNKGVTLVELMVSSAILLLVISAFLSMVASAAKMFARESRELDIQEEAQIVTNQIEGLLTDASLYAGQVGDEIYIVNEDKVHIVSKEATGTYYSVYDFPSSEDATSENVKDLLTNSPGVLKSGGVQSRSLMSTRLSSLALNTDDLDDGNIVYLSLNYDNMERNYGVNQSIYLRNKPGLSGGSGGSTPVDNDFDAELTVLRYKTYNLKTLFGVSSINSNGSTPAISGADAGKYDVNIANGTVAIKGSVGKDVSSAGGATVTCTKNGSNYKIRLSFDAIEIGLGAGETQTTRVRVRDVEQALDYISVKGFDTHADTVKYVVQVSINQLNTSNVTTIKVGSISAPITLTGGNGTSLSDMEKDIRYNNNANYFKGVYRFCLDDRSNHIILRQFGQGVFDGNPVVMYNIHVYHRTNNTNPATYESLGEATIQVLH